MSRLSEAEYAEYCRLLADWVEAEKAAKRPDAADAGAPDRARGAYEAIARFRAEHSMPTAASGDGVPLRIRVEAPRQRWAEEAG